MTSTATEPYSWSPIVSRPPLELPGGARLAFYVGADDQPVAMHQPGMSAVPYSLELNDFMMFMAGPGLTGPDHERAVLDAFSQLLADATSARRVMALPLHPFVSGQPHRTAYLRRALREIVATPEVWVTTSDDVAALVRDPTRSERTD